MGPSCGVHLTADQQGRYKSVTSNKEGHCTSLPARSLTRRADPNVHVHSTRLFENQFVRYLNLNMISCFFIALIHGKGHGIINPILDADGFVENPN
jgi:hypothetical protein